MVTQEVGDAEGGGTNMVSTDIPYRAQNSLSRNVWEASKILAGESSRLRCRMLQIIFLSRSDTVARENWTDSRKGEGVRSYTRSFSVMSIWSVT